MLYHCCSLNGRICVCNSLLDGPCLGHNCLLNGCSACNSLLDGLHLGHNCLLNGRSFACNSLLDGPCLGHNCLLNCRSFACNSLSDGLCLGHSCLLYGRCFACNSLLDGNVKKCGLKRRIWHLGNPRNIVGIRLLGSRIGLHAARLN